MALNPNKTRRRDTHGIMDATGRVFTTGAISVTDTATEIPTLTLENRKAIIIRNWDTDNYVYVGGSGITASTGFPLLPKESLPFDLSDGAQLYGICETGLTAEVRYLEIDNG